jgi:hypothetical protein
MIPGQPNPKKFCPQGIIYFSSTSYAPYELLKWYEIISFDLRTYSLFFQLDVIIPIVIGYLIRLYFTKKKLIENLPFLGSELKLLTMHPLCPPSRIFI